MLMNTKLDQLHILRHEKLKLNLGLEMKKVLNFLGLDFDKNVEFCVMQKKKGSFKRPKSSINRLDSLMFSSKTCLS